MNQSFASNKPPILLAVCLEKAPETLTCTCITQSPAHSRPTLTACPAAASTASDLHTPSSVLLLHPPFFLPAISCPPHHGFFVSILLHRGHPVPHFIFFSISDPRLSFIVPRSTLTLVYPAFVLLAVLYTAPLPFSPASIYARSYATPPRPRLLPLLMIPRFTSAAGGPATTPSDFFLARP